MKSLLIVGLLFVGCNSYADQASDSFGTGFASALQQQIIARQNAEYQAQLQAQYQAQAQPVVVIPNTVSEGHYDVRDNYGNLGDMQFNTYMQCSQYLKNSEMYKECVWIAR